MKPRLLCLDIETGPIEGKFWGLHKQYIGIGQVTRWDRVICWAAKWVGKRQVFFADERAGHKEMLAPIHALLCEADAVFGYNSERFDLRKLDGAFLEHGFPPPPQHTQIDLYKTTKNMGYMSAKLAHIVERLHIGRKLSTGGFDLWVRCDAGDPKAWETMALYNKRDTRLVEALYKRLKPYIRNHPRLVDKDSESCPACRSSKTQRHGTRRTRATIVERFHCQGCGHWFYGKRIKA